MLRTTISGAAALAVLLGTSAARADDDFAIVVLGVTVIGGVGAVDIGFAVHDAVLFGERRAPSEPVAVAETAVSGPQTLLAHIATAALAHERGDDEIKLGLMGPSMVVSALTTHGLWSLARPDEAPEVLFGASTVIGINSAWTTVSLSNAFGGHMPPGPTGVLKIVTTAPTTAWSIAEAVRGDTFQPGWIALSAWSGALLIHGVVETVWGEDGEEVARAPARALGLSDVSVAPVALPDRGAGIALSGRF